MDRENNELITLRMQGVVVFGLGFLVVTFGVLFCFFFNKKTWQLLTTWDKANITHELWTDVKQVDWYLEMLIVEIHLALDMFFSINPDIQHIENLTAVGQQNFVLKICANIHHI